MNPIYEAATTVFMVELVIAMLIVIIKLLFDW